MKTIVPLAFLALAFWLGAAPADEQVRPSQIVLTEEEKWEAVEKITKAYHIVNTRAAEAAAAE